MTTDRRHFALSAEAARLLSAFLDRFDRNALLDLESPDVDVAARTFFVTYLVRHRLFVPEDAEEPRRAADGKSLRVELLSAGQVMRLTAWFGVLFRVPVAIAVAVAAGWWSSPWGPSFAQRPTYADNVGLTLAEFCGLASLVVAMALFHELGHASACRRFSGFAGPVSVALFFGIPTFSVDVSTVSRLDRRQRVVVALSGLYFQVIAIVVASTALRDWPAVGAFVGLGLISLVYNLVPLYRNDGYWALGDWLGRELSFDPARFRDGWIERLYLLWMHAILIVAVVGVVRFCAGVVPSAWDALAAIGGERQVIGDTLLALNVASAVVFAALAVRDRLLAFSSLRKSR